MTDLRTTLHRDAPPDGLSVPLQALWWLAKGNCEMGDEWDKAHHLCQQAEGERDHDVVHALAHMIEGDRNNSDYWYRRAGLRRTHEDANAEWDVVAAKLAG